MTKVVGRNSSHVVCFYLFYFLFYLHLLPFSTQDRNHSIDLDEIRAFVADIGIVDEMYWQVKKKESMHLSYKSPP